ncbi:hypothetical protein [Fluviicola taffensis]|uniref:Lipoprotein n=1 Tax=Fluviicola taffensis (strain DSM 16823 / NCIMB 13979 / RW262) TaxID=755732 RepID=F2IKI2_FLUTR|nr:hypothetical protein [Fluviicola taffensis]AEA45108.1 hypothetical protein Fluta_3134 [Fluviicola taffensis DSM 16823]
MKATLKLLSGLALFLIITSCQSASSNSLSALRENPFPAFEEVYTQVNKLITAPGNNCQFNLAKKADGYYLKIVSWQENKLKDPTFLKVWDAETKKYLKPDLSPYIDKQAYSGQVYDQGLIASKSFETSYDMNYLFGYPNSTHELIELLKDQEDLTSPELEMLARAYSDEACDYIHPNQMGSDILKTKDLPELGYQKLPKNRITSFMELSEKSLDCYRKIQQKDPTFKPLVFDDLNLKINHDILNYYHTMLSVRENERAAVFLKQAKYGEEAIAYAKELLIDCAKNGVLITAGDSDTFPLWYVQEVLGFRKDVTVINYSLLQTAWYFDLIKGTTSVKTSLSKEEYQFYCRTALILNPKNEPVLPYSEWIKQLKASKKPRQIAPKELLGYEDMPQGANMLSLSIQGVKQELSVKNGFMPAVDLCLLDFIHCNPERVFYSSTPSMFYDSPLMNFFAKRNMIYELTAVTSNSTWDDQSFSYLEKAIRANRVNFQSDKDLIRNITGSRLLDYFFNDLTLQDPSHKTFEEFSKQLNLKERIAKNDYKFLEVYFLALSKVDQTKVKQLRDQYAKNALELIQSIDNQKMCTKTDAEKLSALCDMYLDQKMEYEVDGPYEQTNLQRKVLNALKQKLDTLCDNPLNNENLSWTLRNLKRMKNKLQYYR